MDALLIDVFGHYGRHTLVFLSVVASAYALNTLWPWHVPRNTSDNPDLFWTTLLIGSVIAWCTRQKLDISSDAPNRMHRRLTDEWKGWMQVAFILYHYTHATYAYNAIRVCVSAYVFLTGYGNYLYFTKTHDFSLRRVVTVLLRINLLPLSLMLVNKTTFNDYYVVPLHSVYFLVTYACCYVIYKTNREWTCIIMLLVISVVFFEVLDPLPWHEMRFRFGLDKYSTWYGIVLAKATLNEESALFTRGMRIVVCLLSFLGCAIWYTTVGHIGDKYVYNRYHPYITWLPIISYVFFRIQFSNYVLRSWAWLGTITLETYVLQFHMLMCKNVREIIVVFSGLSAFNLVVVGCIFVLASKAAKDATLGLLRCCAQIKV